MNRGRSTRLCARWAFMVTLGPAALSACSLLLTEPAAPAANVEIQFQIASLPPGGTTTALLRVRRAALRFTRGETAARDTVVPVTVVPDLGVLRAAVSIPTDERVDGLDIGARLLGGDAVELFRGGTVVSIVPGTPNAAVIDLFPVPGAVVADRDAFALPAGASQQLSASVLFASGDTVDLLQPIWRSDDPVIATVTPAGLATGAREGQTRLLATIDTLADTVFVTVLPPVPITGSR